MTQNSHRLQYLFEQFVLKRSSSQELDELLDLLKQPAHEEQGREMLEAYFAQPAEETEVDKVFWLSKLEGIKQGPTAGGALPERTPGQIRRLPFGRWWAAAAGVLILVAGIAYLWPKRTIEKPSIANVPSRQDLLPPASAHAILTLADGKRISLDSVANGILADQGTTRITKQKDGQIAYVGDGHPGEMQFNRLEVPRGSRIAAITLDDGTRVWLNSGSSLKYPVAFAARERKVQITGEAYFEVAKREGQAFLVSGGGLTTEVLGTHFNVNVYEDEAEQRVTLLEGAISVHKGTQQDILKPGEQVRISSTGHMNLLGNVDLDEVMAWKNAMFIMEKSDIGMIMRQISRWYNVEVVYSDGIPKGELSGDINRDMELSKVLKVLELSGVHFRMEGRKVIVSP